MEASSESTFRPSKELQKRKRTKRQRAQSLSRLPSISEKISRSSDNITSPLSPSGSLGSTQEIDHTISDEMEEDMADCLILLARGQLRERECQRQKKEEEEDHPVDQDDGPKFISKKYMEAGYFVYQCKTCDKSFPSFQALGGHRASHKKPKTVLSEDKGHPMTESATTAAATNVSYNNGSSSSEDEDALCLQLMMNQSEFSQSLKSFTPLKQMRKVHECSVCGAEFSSGQALGGHMRRHRALPTAPSSSITPPTPESEEPVRPRINGFGSPLDLDLNLPAPEEDQELASVFSFGSMGPDRSDMAFSVPALVGCHY